MADNSLTKYPAIRFLQERKLTGALIISLVFFVVEFILVHCHEPWGDEVHSWAIARSSHSISNLLYNSRYEGHPKLWYLLVYLLQLFTHQIVCMQVLHVFIATLAVFIFCFFSPFGIPKNTLICFGYFFAYEYSIISRNYSIEVVLLFLCAGIYTKYPGRYWGLLAVLFFLLFQTNVYGLIIGILFYGYLIGNLYKQGTFSFKTIAISSILIVLGIITSVLSMKPPSNSGFSTWNTHITLYNLAHTLATVFTSYFPIPLFTSHFWDSNFLNGISYPVYIQAPLSLVILIVAGVLFYKDKKILFLFYAGTLSLLLFTYTKYFGGLRHHGQLYLLFIVCYWLYTFKNETFNLQVKPENNLFPGLPGNIWNKLSLWLHTYFIGLLLIVQSGVSIYANANDIENVFSCDKAVSLYLKENKLDTLPILGDGDYEVSGIAGILDKDIYYMRPKYWGRYITLDSNWGNYIRFSETDLLNQVDSISGLKKSDVVVILSYPFSDGSLSNWKLLKTFNGSITTEDYILYKVSYVPPDPIKINASGEVLLSKGYLNQAIKLFTKAIQIKPGYSTAYMNLADCYNNGLHDFRKALVYIDSAIKYAPNDAKVVFDKGAILFNKGDQENALPYFKETIRLQPMFINAYFTTARCYISKGDNDSAIIYLTMFLKKAPENAAAFRMLSQCYKNKNDKLNAAIFEKKAEKIENAKRN